MDPHQTPHGSLAAEFANALVAGNFERAHGMLSSAAKGEWDPVRLQATFQQMVEYFESPPNFVQVMEVMTEWPARQPHDVGWAYAAIAGLGESEAVTVVVSSENGTHVIRSIEWGRP
jgi:hypothetical protein